MKVGTPHRSHRCTGCGAVGHNVRSCEKKTTIAELRWLTEERMRELKLTHYYRRRARILRRRKRQRALRRYRQSEKGRTVNARYEATEKARARYARYRQTDKRRAVLHRYNVSEKGRARKREWQRRKRAGVPIISVEVTP